MLPAVITLSAAITSDPLLSAEPFTLAFKLPLSLRVSEDKEARFTEPLPAIIPETSEPLSRLREEVESPKLMLAA